MRFLPRQNLISQELWVSFVRWWLARRCGCAMGRVGVDLGVLAYAVMAVLAAMHNAGRRSFITEHLLILISIAPQRRSSRSFATMGCLTSSR